jgi:acetyl esterase
MPLDPVARIIIDTMEAEMPPIAGGNAATVRAELKARPLLPVTEDIASSEDRTIPGPDGEIPVRVYRPLEPSSDPAPGVVFFHGGGWVICDLDSHDGTCRRMANAVGAVVVSIDYRLAPEHKHPAAVEDAYAATRWVAEHAGELGIDPDRLAIAGDSAGGHLTAVVAQMARDRGAPPLAFQLMVYPVIDSTSGRNDRPSRSENATGYFLTLDAMEWYREQYLPDDASGEDASASPHVADSLAGLPPACVITAEMDLLRDEGEHYARLLEQSGVPVMLYRADGMFHGFFGMEAVLDGAKAAQQVAFDAMRAGLGVKG